MSECLDLNNDESMPQSETLPTMMGGHSHPNDDDMNHNTSTNNYDVASSSNLNPPPHSNYYPHPEEAPAPSLSWGVGNPSSAANMGYNYHHHVPPVPPPHPHGSYPHHNNKGHEPPPHHHGYPPYTSASHYPYPHHHDPHYPPPPPTSHHYPPKYTHPNMYHPNYYHPPPPQYHHYSPHPPTMPPPHSGYHSYSAIVQHQDVSPHHSVHQRNDEVVHNNVHNNVNHTYHHQHYQQHHHYPQQQHGGQVAVNMVTPSIDTLTPGDTFNNDGVANNISPDDNDDIPANNDAQVDEMEDATTKKLFSPHIVVHRSTTGYTTSGGEVCRKHRVHKSIMSKGLLPLDYTNDDDAVVGTFHSSLQVDGKDCSIQAAAKATSEVENDEVNDNEESAVLVTLSKVAATAANTAAQFTSLHNTSNNNKSKTSPRQMAELQSISNQARAHIAKMRACKLNQQVESWRVADIACVSNAVPFERGVTVESEGGGGERAKKGVGKERNGFEYPRQVGNKHYKKLFEKGLVPKDEEDVDTRVKDVNGATLKEEEEPPNIEEMADKATIGVEHGVANVVRGEVPSKDEEHMELPRPRIRQTQLLYPHPQKRRASSSSSSDGYELRVIPTEDGNDFHVELVQPDGEVDKSVKKPGVEQVKEVDGAAVGGEQKNDGEFDSAVDSILDAAETIAKRASPRASPVAVPKSQEQHMEFCELPLSSSKRRREELLQGCQEEKRQRSNSIVSFNPCAYPATSTHSYPLSVTVRPSPSHETRAAAPSPQSNTAIPAPNNAYSQIICQDRKEKRGRRTYCFPNPSVDLTEYYSSRQEVTKTETEELTALALCAASHIQKEPVLFRAILLNMALERERHSLKKHSGGAPTHLKNLALRRHSSTQNSDGSAADVSFLSALDSSGKKVIRDGFFWKDVPELEKVLQKHMMEYYFMSENRPQSKKQQQFNNRLVSLVYQEAIARGFIFDPVTFSLEGHSPLDYHSTINSLECSGNWVVPSGFNHKKLRDRIRCYYKTHVQNSKKRLGTLLKNPMKEKNRDTLLRLVDELKRQEHVELSSECVLALKRLKAEQDSIIGTISSPDGASTSSYETRPSAGYADNLSEQTTTPYSSRATISDGGSGGSSTSSAHSLKAPQDVTQPASTAFSPFKHASLLSSMRQLDSQRH